MNSEDYLDDDFLDTIDLHSQFNYILEKEKANTPPTEQEVKNKIKNLKKKTSKARRHKNSFARFRQDPSAASFIKKKKAQLELLSQERMLKEDDP